MEVIVSNLPFFLKGLSATLTLAGMAIAGSLLLGIGLGSLRSSCRRLLSLPATVVIDLIRGTPLILVIFWFYFLIPLVIGRTIDSFFSALIALTIFTSAYVAEIVRGGFMAVSRGQVEAGLATGLSHRQVALYVVIPQAVRAMVPALISQFIALFKDTSLAYIIGVMELTRAATIVNNREFQSFPIFTFVAFLYFLFCYALSVLARWLERRQAQRTGGLHLVDFVHQMT